MDFDKLDQQTNVIEPAPSTTPKTENVNNEDGTQTQRIVAHSSALVEVSNSFRYHFTNIITEKTLGPEPSVKRFLENEEQLMGPLEESVVNNLFSAMSVASSWGLTATPIFTTSSQELQDSVDRFEALCSRFEREKTDQLSKNRGTTTPKFSFTDLAAKVRKAHTALETYLKESFSFEMRELIVSGDSGDYTFFCFNPEQRVSEDVANSRFIACEISFTVLPETTFRVDELFELQKEGDDPSTPIPFENWFEIRCVKFRKEEIAESLIPGNFVDLASVVNIVVQRNQLLGDYKKLRAELVDDSIRNIWEQFYSIKENFLGDGKNSLTWEDFCAYYVRPPITVVEEKEWKPLKKDLKSLDEKLKEDKKIYDAKERKKIAEKNKGKRDETDSGFLEDLKRDIKSTKDLDSLFAALNKTKLGAFAKASFDCLHQVSMFSKDETNPEIFDPFSSAIPDIKVPKFSFPETPVTTGPSQNIAPMALEQIKNMALQATLSQLDSFFTVEKCEDFNKFFNKNAWNALKDSLQAALKKDWDNFMTAIQWLFDEASCFSAEEILSLFYKAADILPPEKVVALIQGSSNGPTPLELAQLSYLVLGSEKLSRCGIPSASLVASVAAEISFFRPRLVDELQAVIDSPPQDFTLESRIKCETSYENFMQWLLDNGVPVDTVQCMMDNTKEEKTRFLRGLERYIRNNGKSEVESPFILDSSIENTITQMCRSEFSSVFDAFSKNVADYPLFLTQGTGAQFGVTNEDVAFLDTVSGINVNAAKKVVGFEDTTQSYSSKDPYELIPFLEILNDVFKKPAFYDPLFPNYVSFTCESKLNDSGNEEVYELSYKDFTMSLSKSFGPMRRHKRVLRFGVSDIEFGGVPFSGDEPASFVAPAWSKMFADIVVNSLPSREDEYRESWNSALIRGISTQVKISFVDFLAEQVRKSKIGQPFYFETPEGYKPISSVEVLAKKMRMVPGESCDEGDAVFGRDAFCNKITNFVKEEMKRIREYRYDLVTPIGMSELAPRVAAIHFLLGTPFLAEMFQSYKSSDRLVSNYILWKFPELQDELGKHTDHIRILTDPVFTQDDYRRANGLDDEEVIDNSGDEAAKESVAGRYQARISFPSLSHLKMLDKTQSNFEAISSGFANLLNSKTTWIRSWVDSLPFWQVSGYQPSLGLLSFDFKKRVMFSLGVEYFFGEWKCVKIEGNDIIWRGENLFVNYSQNELNTTGQNGSNPSVQKYRVTLNLNIFSQSVSNDFRMGQGKPFRLISPIVSVEFRKGQIVSELELFAAAKEAISNSPRMRQVLEEYLGFGELFELFNVFLFELTNRTTNFGRFLGDGLTFVPESQGSLKEQEQALNSVASDTFGILRSKFSVSDIQKMALKMALKTPYLIFKSQVEMVDPVIRKARKIVDEAKMRGTKLDFAKVALIDLRPLNLWSVLAKSPPITPAGMLYVLLERKNKSSEEFAALTDPEEFPEILVEGGLPMVYGKMCVKRSSPVPERDQNAQVASCPTS